VTPADVLDRALDTGWDGSTPASVRALITLAAEVSEALAAVHLTRRERERIYARSLTLLEEAVNEQRRGWHHALRLQRHAPLLVGGAAALTIGAAAIAWALVHGRRPHLPAAA
jgi:hypothetical protein